MQYTSQEEEFIKVQLESIESPTTIARNFIKKFNSDREMDAVRDKVTRIREKCQIEASKKPIKRLFFDIEMSYNQGWFWRTGKQWVDFKQINEHKKIICISYKWYYEDKVHTITWDENQDDKKLINDFIKILAEADEIIGHNSDRFDIKEIRTRAILQDELMFNKYRTLDTLKKARKYFNFPSNKLDYLGQILGVGRKLDHEGIDLWHKVILLKDKKALKKMVRYCEQDVLLLEEVWHKLSPYIDVNTNFAVHLGKAKYNCPNCAGEDVEIVHTDTTRMGFVKRHFKCNDCRKQYHISNKSYMKYLTDKNKK